MSARPVMTDAARQAAPAAVRPVRRPAYQTITVPADLLAAYVGLFRVAESVATSAAGAGSTPLGEACSAVRKAGG